MSLEINMFILLGMLSNFFYLLLAFSPKKIKIFQNEITHRHTYSGEQKYLNTIEFCKLYHLDIMEGAEIHILGAFWLWEMAF